MSPVWGTRTSQRNWEVCGVKDRGRAKKENRMNKNTNGLGRRKELALEKEDSIVEIKRDYD